MFAALSDLPVLPTFLIIGAVCAAAGYAMGKQLKGRPELGAILGGALGFLGLIILIFMDDYRRRCPHCRSVVDADATICRACRSPLPVAGEPVGAI